MGFFDPNGVWRYEETDLAADSTFSATLNKLGESVSDELQAVKDAITGVWQTPVLQNGWTAFGSGRQDPRYRRVGDVVELEGWLRPGTTTSNTVLFTLPAGFRPAADQLIIGGSGNTTYYIVRIYIASNGEVRIWNPTPTDFVAINGQFSVL